MGLIWPNTTQLLSPSISAAKNSPGSPAGDEAFVLLGLDFAPGFSIIGHTTKKAVTQTRVPSQNDHDMFTFTIRYSSLLLYMETTYCFQVFQTESHLGSKKNKTTPEFCHH